MNAPPPAGPSWIDKLFSQDPTATPPVTAPQAAAIAQALLAVLIVFGFSPSDNAKLVIGTISTALVIALPVSDAAIRRKRIDNIGPIVEAQKAHAGNVRAAQGNPGHEARIADLEKAVTKLKARKTQTPPQTPTPPPAQTPPNQP